MSCNPALESHKILYSASLDWDVSPKIHYKFGTRTSFEVHYVSDLSEDGAKQH